MLMSSYPPIADVGWVWRIMLSSHEAKPAKAGMPIPGDDDVVMDSDPKQLADLVNLLGHVDVGPGRGGVAGRMVVHEDAAGSMQFDGSPQNLTRVHRRMIYRAFGQDLVSDQVVALVEVENAELLARRKRHRGGEIVDDELPPVEARPLHQEPLGHNAANRAEQVEQVIVVQLLGHCGTRLGEPRDALTRHLALPLIKMPCWAPHRLRRPAHWLLGQPPAR